MKNDKAVHLYRRECERCGARLKQAKQKGKYYCEYCGMEYFEQNFDPGNYSEVDEIDPAFDRDQDFTSEHATVVKNTKQKKPILLLSLFIFFCLLSIYIGVASGGLTSIFSSSSPNIQEAKLSKPEMLTVLPDAEYAGKAIAFTDWEIYVYPEFSTADNRLYFSFSIQNWSDETRQLYYLPKDIIIYDNLGKEYSLSIGNCSLDAPYLTRQITFSPYEKIEFQSRKSWCSSETNIPPFSGVLSNDLTNLYIHFTEFGVFTNITFVFDL